MVISATKPLLMSLPLAMSFVIVIVSLSDVPLASAFMVEDKSSLPKYTREARKNLSRCRLERPEGLVASSREYERELVQIGLSKVWHNEGKIGRAASASVFRG
jgi:hypothetical protein